MVQSIGGRGGNINMRGRRTMGLRCRCCVLVDLRPKFTAIEHQKEMRDAMSTETIIGDGWGGNS